MAESLHGKGTTGIEGSYVSVNSVDNIWTISSTKLHAIGIRVAVGAAVGAGSSLGHLAGWRTSSQSARQWPFNSRG